MVILARLFVYFLYKTFFFYQTGVKMSFFM